MEKIKNRIIGSGVAKLDEILFNPRNWRIHPLNQQDALKSVLDNVGWVQEVIVNQRTGNLVDGHLRCQLAARNGETEIPVKYVDLSEDEEALILATIDPIAGMAATDKTKLDELMEYISTEDERIKSVLDNIAGKEIDYQKEWEGMPEFINTDKTAFRSIHIHFHDNTGVEGFSKLIGQKITDSTVSIWYPEIKIERYSDKVYIKDA